MRRPLIAVVLLLAGSADAQVDMDSSVSDATLRAYYDVIGEAFSVTRKEILIIRQEQIRDHQIPVVLFLARQAKVKPREIVAARLRGADYLAIAARYKLTGEIFRFPCANVTGQPYQDAFAHLDARDKNLLTDDDIINLVLLRILVDRYHCAPDAVMKPRAEGANFVQINLRLAEAGQAAR